MTELPGHTANQVPWGVIDYGEGGRHDDDAAIDRLSRLEAAIAAHGLERVPLDAAGEPDADVLVDELAELGIAEEACVPDADGWCAAFVRDGHRYEAHSPSRANARIEAAVAALAATDDRVSRRRPGPLRRWRPDGRSHRG